VPRIRILTLMARVGAAMLALLMLSGISPSRWSRPRASIVHSPAVPRVVQACLPASHGALTPAKVREALNNAGR